MHCFDALKKRFYKVTVDTKQFPERISISLWGKMPNLQKQKIENMSIFLASWMYLMVLIDNSSFFVIKNCTFNA